MFFPIRSLHFVGIGGTAMAGTAVALRNKGFEVTGSDQKVYDPMAGFLKEHQLPVMEGFAEANLSHQPDLVVIGNAISRGNPEVEAILERKVPYCSLPELLKRFFIEGKHAIVVTGTHGKTSITALLAWVFDHNGYDPSFLIGGIPRNWGYGARFTESQWFILEGDEYDTAFFDKQSKFLHYLPEVAIINNLEFDHADIFADLASIQSSFRRLINLVPRNGLLLANGEDSNLHPLLADSPAPVSRFGLEGKNDVQPSQVVLDPEASELQLDGMNFRIPQVGELNVRNALPVIACARHFGMNDQQIQSAFDTFLGTQRRMQVLGTVRGITVVDDFAHHPTAIRETVRALRLKFPHQRLWLLFEPRSNTSRRNVFQQELTTALSQGDTVVIAEVARLEQLPSDQRLDPEKVVSDLNALAIPAAYLPTVDRIVQHVTHRTESGDVVCVLSNGGFGGIHQLLLDAIGKTGEKSQSASPKPAD